MSNKILLLFDIDGTLTTPRLKISEDMVNILQEISKQKIYNKGIIDIGFVGGSDLSKQLEQLGEENIDLFTWKFTENGLLSYYKDELLNKTSLLDYLGENNYQKLINVCLKVLSNTSIPVKRSHFIELRNGMINISPIGRSCSQKERDDFDLWDKKNKIRDKIIKNIQDELPELKLQFSIGGQISIDIFPQGWDKTFCLQFIHDKYDDIYFFGDKTSIGGNDYELYNHPRVKGIRVNTYKDTIDEIKKLIT